MNLKKIAPWNWFKDEEKEDIKPVSNSSELSASPLVQLHNDLDNVFASAFGNLGFPRFSEMSRFSDNFQQMLLKPNVDIIEEDDKYNITAEIPGVDEKDVTLELNNDNLVIKGEKKNVVENKKDNYHTIERSYGSFQRVFNLPEDVDKESISATFEKGVLNITMPKTAVKKSDKKQITIN